MNNRKNHSKYKLIVSSISPFTESLILLIGGKILTLEKNLYKAIETNAEINATYYEKQIKSISMEI